MVWNRWYAARSYVRTALWIVPLLALVMEQVFIHIAASVDAEVVWIPWVGATAEGILGEMDAIVTLAISFLVFTFGSLLVAVQVASGQLTPRIIATTLLRDNVIRFTVGLFAFTLFFAVGIKARSDDKILHVGGTLVVFLAIGSTMAFLFLIDYTARLLRPVAIVWRIGELGIEVLESVYPESSSTGSLPPRSCGCRSDGRRVSSLIGASPASCWRSIWQHWWPLRVTPMASSNASTEWEISSPQASRCFICMAALPRWMIAGCARRWPSVPRGLSNRTPPSPSG